MMVMMIRGVIMPIINMMMTSIPIAVLIVIVAMADNINNDID